MSFWLFRSFWTFIQIFEWINLVLQARQQLSWLIDVSLFDDFSENLRLVLEKLLCIYAQISFPEMIFRDSFSLICVKSWIRISWALLNWMTRFLASIADVTWGKFWSKIWKLLLARSKTSSCIIRLPPPHLGANVSRISLSIKSDLLRILARLFLPLLHESHQVSLWVDLTLNRWLLIFWMLNWYWRSCGNFFGLHILDWWRHGGQHVTEGSSLVLKKGVFLDNVIISD